MRRQCFQLEKRSPLAREEREVFSYNLDLMTVPWAWKDTPCRMEGSD